MAKQICERFVCNGSVGSCLATVINTVDCALGTLLHLCIDARKCRMSETGTQ